MATASKPTTPAFKVGHKVTHAKHGAGKVTALDFRINGLWLTVDFGDKKSPAIKNVRPSAVTRHP